MDHIFYDSLYKTSSLGRSTEMESTLMVARGLGGEEANNGECRVSFWGEKNVLKLTVMMVVQFCEYPKNH